MSSTRDRLKAKFMIGDSNGIAPATKIIEQNGGWIDRTITPPVIHYSRAMNTDLANAINFLVWEYQFKWQTKPQLVSTQSPTQQESKPDLTTMFVELVNRANRMRATPIVDNDFPEMLQLFDNYLYHCTVELRILNLIK